MTAGPVYAVRCHILTTCSTVCATASSIEAKSRRRAYRMRLRTRICTEQEAANLPRTCAGGARGALELAQVGALRRYGTIIRTNRLRSLPLQMGLPTGLRTVLETATAASFSSPSARICLLSSIFRLLSSAFFQSLVCSAICFFFSSFSRRHCC